MRAAFRADASIAIGNGHVARCLVLAEALRRHGVESIFLCRALRGHPADWIARRGFEVRLLPDDLPLDEDAAACATVLSGGTDALIVDHYGLDRRWEAAMRDRCRLRLAIDDLPDRVHECEILLDPNLAPRMEERHARGLPPSCRQLLGPRHALLHPAFGEWAPRAPERARVRRLLLFFGGGDAADLTGRALRELEPLDLPGDVVIGAAHPRRAAIEALCPKSSGLWTLHVQTDRMPELMANADLALGAGGGSHWERCLMGLPAIVAVAADNQAASTAALAARGACLSLGPAESLASGAFLGAVETLATHPADLAAMSRAARGVVPDGAGAERVAQALLEALP